MAKHFQSGISWDGDGRTQIQHDKDQWYIVLTKDGNTSRKRVGKHVARMLLEGGMAWEG